MSNSIKEKKDFKSILNMDIKDIGGYLFKNTKEVNVNKEKKDIFERFKRAKKVVAFDMGESSIKVAEGSYFKGHLIVNNLIEIPTPKDVVADGKIVNVEYLAGILSFNLKESSITAKDAICTTNSSLIINREIVIPKVEEDEYETVIRFEIQQYLPINLDDYVIQYTLLEEIEDIEDMGKAKVRVNVVSFPEKMSYSYYDLLTKAKLSPYALDVTHNSLNKLLNYCSSINGNELNKEDTITFIDMGASSINVTIFNKGKLDFTRIIKFGGQNIDFEVGRILGKSIKTIENMKIEKADLLDLDNNTDLNNAVRNIVDEMLGELGRVLQFYKNKTVGNKIDKVYIYGGLAELKGLDKYLSNNLKIKTEKINTLGNVDITNKEVLSESITSYVNVIGSIIRLQ